MTPVSLVKGDKSLHVLSEQHITEKIEDIIVVIRIHQSKKDRKFNGQKKKEKRTHNDLQNST